MTDYWMPKIYEIVANHICLMTCNRAGLVISYGWICRKNANKWCWILDNNFLMKIAKNKSRKTWKHIKSPGLNMYSVYDSSNWSTTQMPEEWIQHLKISSNHFLNITYKIISKQLSYDKLLLANIPTLWYIWTFCDFFVVLRMHIKMIKKKMVCYSC